MGCRTTRFLHHPCLTCSHGSQIWDMKSNGFASPFSSRTATVKLGNGDLIDLSMEELR
jgi:hypothetical protein